MEGKMSKSKEILRFVLVALIIVGAMGVFVYNLMIIQVANGEKYLESTLQGTPTVQTITAARGEIVDRNGNPFTSNRLSYDIVFDRAFMEYGEENAIILELISLMEKNSCSWIDNLPLSSSSPFVFTDDDSSASLKLKKFLGIREYASAEEVFYWLTERYSLEEYEPEVARKIAGVRYEMSVNDFSVSFPYTFEYDVGQNIASVIKENSSRLPGVEIITTAKREYVAGTIAPHVIGRTGLLSSAEYSVLLEEGKVFNAATNISGYKYSDTIGKDGI